ncbi:hypothetical protein [Anaerofustis sp.]|uniref:hypothetical protein n=1 Tax=Anaerofustis sp. TaxID=1872517 RepID=UPI0025B96F44|nr:hypothetical protein [Anaerofustis sp.]
MSFYKLMFKSLSDLMKRDEILNCPIYGSLIQGKSHYFGYFGLTNVCLLVVLLRGDSKDVINGTRIPFNNISKVKVKKSLVPMQYIINIDFCERNSIKIRVSKKVLGFDMQEENLEAFLNRIKII